MLNKIEPYMRFTGKATRREYWSVMLYSSLALVLWFFLVTLFGAPLFLIIVAMIPVIVMQWATITRRQCDMGLSWWWLALIFVPYIGMLWWLLLGILPGGMFSGQGR
jgi:uncharacterized membrane protein YhaH (DUF805 family)